MDTERGKRPGTFDDFRNFIRLSEHFDVIHMTGPSVEPQDIPPNLRHLEMTRVQMVESAKPTFIYSRGAPQVKDCIEILKLRHGLTHETLPLSAHDATRR